ncbi:uncharacterized protein BCR38DRAFT_411970 [Pseudomassariella vexata]|uniref:Uncharacterized protein n=1 Tax=Pseudomassariella vexata TaxID=1141098 RepID=A0A1Y2DNV8_9PEZI|nr:uncharacterized protein BCR38DRAFT_411970 [Pseudomassariella vexata]ORY60859.1 hypothetical protein BCR38DRAFT_411970 [Pseudomassariella vexata]
MWSRNNSNSLYPNRDASHISEIELGELELAAQQALVTMAHGSRDGQVNAYSTHEVEVAQRLVMMSQGWNSGQLYFQPPMPEHTKLKSFTVNSLENILGQPSVAPDSLSPLMAHPSKHDNRFTQPTTALPSPSLLSSIHPNLSPRLRLSPPNPRAQSIDPRPPPLSSET